MSWFALIGAGMFEMLAVVMMHLYNQKRSWLYLSFMAYCFALSFILLSFSMQEIPMGTAYAVWTGIGAAGGAITGMIYFYESRSRMRVFFISLIIAAAVGLKLVS